MGWVDGMLSSGLFAKIAFALMVAQSFFNWIAFTTTSWGIIKFDTTGDNTHIGIWRHCKEVAKTCYGLDGYANIWYGIFQALSTIAFVSCNVALVMVLFFMFFDGCKRNKELGQAAAVTSTLSAVIWLVVVIIFGEMYFEDDDVSGTSPNDKELGYSHTIAIFALLIEAISGVLLLIEALQSPIMGKPQPGQHFQMRSSRA